MVYYFLAFMAATILAVTTSHAFVVSPTDVVHLNAEHGVWKPSGAVTIREDVACARAHQEACEGCLHESTAVCSFDGGKSIYVQQTHHPFCGDRGVVVGGNLLCPLHTKPVDENVINVTVVAYAAESSLVETVDDVRMLSFINFPGVSMMDIEFKGSTVFLPEEDLYFMNAAVTLGNASSLHVLFRSHDGYVWNAWSSIPLNVTDMSALTRQGQNRLTVSAFTPGEHHIVSYDTKEGRWGSLKSLNTSVPPAALLFGNGIVFESGLSNRSDILQLRGFVEGKPWSANISSLIDFYKAASPSSQIPEDFTTGCEGGVPCLTSSQVALVRFQPSRVTAFFDYASPGTQRMSITGVTMDIDDSEERDRILKKIQQEEARRIAQEAAAERRKKERLEKRKRDQEKKARFALEDAENIKLATSRLPEDGEMIVVRDVLEDFIEIEKRTFFW